MNYSITVKPGSKKAPLIETTGENCLTVYVRQRAIDGAANKEVIQLLAKHFGVAKSSVEILRGHKGRQKIICIETKSSARHFI